MAVVKIINLAKSRKDLGFSILKYNTNLYKVSSYCNYDVWRVHNTLSFIQSIPVVEYHRSAKYKLVMSSRPHEFTQR